MFFNTLKALRVILVACTLAFLFGLCSMAIGIFALGWLLAVFLYVLLGLASGYVAWMYLREQTLFSARRSQQEDFKCEGLWDEACRDETCTQRGSCGSRFVSEVTERIVAMELAQLRKINSFRGRFEIALVLLWPAVSLVGNLTVMRESWAGRVSLVLFIVSVFLWVSVKRTVHRLVVE